MIGEATLADAILDRLVNNAHRLKLTGDSIRKVNVNLILGVCLVLVSMHCRMPINTRRGSPLQMRVPVMIKSRALSLFAASTYSMFVIIGCNAPMDENGQAGAGEGELAGIEQHICDPKAGTHGQMWVLESAFSQYVYRGGWCSIGTHRPPMCFQGTYYYTQSILHSYAWSGGSSGSFSDPDAWWLVTCNSLIDCIYDCSGQCVRASC